MKPETKIHLLDHLTINRIAAGEVVERPASVVKELIENAIDAGATRIEVRVFDAACQKIQVTDNGVGMSPTDMRLALQRHATSKIRTAKDLDSLTTLGFRGEALPSIAAVSEMTVTSCQAGAHGYTLRVVDGRAGLPQETAARRGTIILVDRLFYNTPARRKFLKSPRTELSAISDIVARLALSHAEIVFTLRSGNHRAMVTSGNGDLAQVVQSIYGRDLAQSMLQVEGVGEIPIHGLISIPSHNRGTRSASFFVNGRFVVSRELAHAVEDGYYTLLPAGRYPTVFLFLTLAPDSVDVNVHPAKLEIKLRDPEPIKAEIRNAVHAALYKNKRIIPLFSGPAIQPGERIDTPPPKITPIPVRVEQQTIKPLLAHERRRLSGAELYRALYKGVDLPDTPLDLDEEKLAALADGKTVDTQAPAPSLAEKRLCYSALHVIGQYLGSYILATGEEGLYIIDQHAAAERVLYEKIAAEAADAKEDSALLAVPLPVQLSYADHLLLTEHIFALRDFGFILEFFGDTTYLIRGVPTWYDDNQAESLLNALLDQIRSDGVDAVKLRREELFLAACKRAIKANRYLTQQDISGLFTALDEAKNASTCPHGRPIAILLTEGEIRKRFLRSSI